MTEESINIAEVKKHFSELIGQVAYGKKQVIITKRGKPMARLVPVEAPAPRLGDVRGWLEADDPFFEIMEHIVADRRHHVPRALADLEKE